MLPLLVAHLAHASHMLGGSGDAGARPRRVGPAGGAREEEAADPFRAALRAPVRRSAAMPPAAGGGATHLDDQAFLYEIQRAPPTACSLASSTRQMPCTQRPPSTTAEPSTRRLPSSRYSRAPVFAPRRLDGFGGCTRGFRQRTFGLLASYRSTATYRVPRRSSSPSGASQGAASCPVAASCPACSRTAPPRPAAAVPDDPPPGRSGGPTGTIVGLNPNPSSRRIVHSPAPAGQGAPGVSRPCSMAHGQSSAGQTSPAARPAHGLRSY